MFIFPCFARLVHLNATILLSGIFDGSLSSSQTGDRHTEGRAADVVQTNVVAELHARGIAAVLAADAQTQIGAGLTAIVGSHLDQLADADLIQMLERIALVDLVLVVCAQELGSVITAEAEGHLGQVVGAEAEELSLLGDLAGSQGCTGDLDHGTDLVLHVNASSSDQLISDLDHNVLDELQLLDLANQRDHDVRGDHATSLSGDVQGSLDHSAGLHGSDFGIGNSQTATTVTHHGVELVQRSHDVLQVVEGHAHIGSQLLDVLVLGGQELVQRGIQVADGHRALTHDAVHGLEVTLLERLDLSQSSFALFHGTGADHLADSLDAVLSKEHVLGTAGSWLYGEKPFRVFNNAIELDRFTYDASKRKAVRQELGLGDELVLGHVGRFCYAKNHEFLLDVMAEVCKQRPDAVLLLVGEGENEAAARRKAEALGLQRNVRFLGRQSDPAKFYQAMDAFVLPSRYEGLGIVLIEAQAAALPVICSTEVPQEAQVLPEMQYLSLQESPAVWADAAIRAAEDARRRDTSAEMRAGGFDIVTEAKKLEEFYFDLLK